MPWQDPHQGPAIDPVPLDSSPKHYYASMPANRVESWVWEDTTLSVKSLATERAAQEKHLQKGLLEVEPLESTCDGQVKLVE